MEKIKKKLGISKAEIREGTKDELEHTNVTSKAKKIALDHLKKHPFKGKFIVNHLIMC